MAPSRCLELSSPPPVAQKVAKPRAGKPLTKTVLEIQRDGRPRHGQRGRVGRCKHSESKSRGCEGSGSHVVCEVEVLPKRTGDQANSPRQKP